MALLAATLLKLEISTDTGTTWKELICEISNTLNFTRETQTAPFTKCDTATAAQEITPTSSNWSFDYDALLSTSPSGTQVTYSDFITLAVNGTSFLVRAQYDNTGSEVYEKGTGYITSFTRTAPADGFVGFSGTISGSGALDITA
jgi:calcineurin-like phosphoesterase